MLEFNGQGRAEAGYPGGHSALSWPGSRHAAAAVFDTTVDNYCRPASRVRAVMATCAGGLLNQPTSQSEVATRDPDRIAA